MYMFHLSHLFARYSHNVSPTLKNRFSPCSTTLRFQMEKRDKRLFQQVILERRLNSTTRQLLVFDLFIQGKDFAGKTLIRVQR
jgi:hypothetical protein